MDLSDWDCEEDEEYDENPLNQPFWIVVQLFFMFVWTLGSAISIGLAIKWLVER